MILELCYKKLLSALALTWLSVTSSQRGANWEATLLENSVQLMHFLSTKINLIKMCLYLKYLYL